MSEFVGKLLISPEAKLALLNALISFMWAVFVFILLANARRGASPTPLSANYFFSIFGCFLTFTVAYVLRTINYMGYFDSIVVSIAGALIFVFLFVSAVQLGSQMGELPNWASRLFRLLRLNPDKFGEFFSYYGVGIILAILQCIIVIFGWSKGGGWSWLSAIAVAGIAAPALWLLMIALWATRTVVWLWRLVMLGLFGYGLEQIILGIPGEVRRMDPLNSWVNEYALQVDFAGMAFAVLGKFFIAFGMVLVSNEIREKNRLRAIENTRCELSEGIDHDITAPVRRICLGIDVALLRPTSGGQDRARGLGSKKLQLRAVKSCSRYLLLLVKDILHFSRNEESRLILRPKSCQMRKLLASTTEMARLCVNRREVEFCLQIHPDVPERVRIDRRVQRVLMNLLTNALHHTTEGKVTLDLKSTREADRRATLHFAVEDTGRGIPKDELEKIFQRGYSTTKGRGLGLAIVKSLVGMMGGSISVTSTPGQGSRFAFDIPVLVEDDRSQPDQTPTVDGEAVCAGHLLLVENDAFMSDCTSQLLESKGFTVSVAGTGEDALQSMKDQQFDAVILDLRLGGELDGLELTRRVRELEQQTGSRRVPVIALSATRRSNKLLGECREVGIDEFLSKSCSISRLVKTLQRHLASRAGKQVNRLEALSSPAQALTDPPVDLARLQGMFTDPETRTHMIRMFLDHLENSFLPVLLDSFGRRSSTLDDLDTATHNLAGALDRMCAPVAANLALQLFVAAQQTHQAIAQKALDDLLAEVERVRQFFTHL